MLVLAAAFGAAMAAIKGNDAGLRDAIGNASAPWLLLPFLAGACTSSGAALAGRGAARTEESRRASTGAVTGLGATLAALAGFYFTNSFVLDLGPHPWLTDLALTMRGGVFWAERALISGPLFGALGAWWARSRSLVAAGAIAAAFVLEPAAWWLYGRYLGGGAAYPVPGYPALWLTEIGLGVAGFAAARQLTSRPPRPRRSSVRGDK